MEHETSQAALTATKRILATAVGRAAMEAAERYTAAERERAAERMLEDAERWESDFNCA